MSDGAAAMALQDLQATVPAKRTGGSAFGRALGTALFFAAVGPLIGGAIVGLDDILAVVGGSGDLGNVVYFLFAFVSVGVPVAYTIGLVPAAIAGASLAAIDFGHRRSDPWLAVVIGALGGMLWPAPWGLPPATLSSPLEVRIFVASIVSTWICWFLSTRQPRRREASPT